MHHLLADHLTRAGRTEARVVRTRAFYQDTVGLQLGARSEAERTALGECMYLAMLATIEARYNPAGCRRFRSRAEACLRSAGKVARDGRPPPTV